MPQRGINYTGIAIIISWVNNSIFTCCVLFAGSSTFFHRVSPTKLFLFGMPELNETVRDVSLGLQIECLFIYSCSYQCLDLLLVSRSHLYYSLKACAWNMRIARTLCNHSVFSACITMQVTQYRCWIFNFTGSATYELVFFPTCIGETTGSIIFYHNATGEFWYDLNLMAENPAISNLPNMTCELGR